MVGALEENRLLHALGWATNGCLLANMVCVLLVFLEAPTKTGEHDFEKLQSPRGWNSPRPVPTPSWRGPLP